MNSLAQEIKREMIETGPIRFSRFMELALYAPGRGYYETQTEIGQRGDFYTSVSVGNLFGSLLARQFADWLEQDGCYQNRAQWVEAGAHGGQLAADILSWLRDRVPRLFSRLEYWLVEPSPVRRAWQETALREFASKVRWTDDLRQFTAAGQGIRGILFSNELLDAMPVDRLRWNATSLSWDEWLVGIDLKSPPCGADLRSAGSRSLRLRGRTDSAQTRFEWRTGPLGADLAGFAPQIPRELATVLPDGFTTEISPAATRWWREAARSLAEGVLMTLDYGMSGDEFLVPERRAGTARAYLRHRVSADVLDSPGEQDITAHVNFSALQQTGESEGLKTVRLATQRSLLTDVFERVVKRPEDFQPWTPSAIRQFQTLTHPEHLGRSFKVLIQRR